MSRREPSLRALEAAVAGEVEAARSLSGALRKARGGAEGLDPEALAAGLAGAEREVAALSRAGAKRARLAGEAARALGLPGSATLAHLAGAASDFAADGLVRATAELRHTLGEVAHEAAVLGICARFGAASTGHLLGLRQRAAGAAPSYGPGGRVGHHSSRLTCRA